MALPVDDPTAPFIDAWIKQESGGNPRAVSKAGARGLLQIMPTTARDYGISNADLLFNPTVNVAVAKRYLNDLTKKYNGNTTLALMAYNDGPGNIDKWLAGKRQLPEETKRYAVNILKGGQAAMQVPPAMLDSGTRAAAKPDNVLEVPPQAAAAGAAAPVARPIPSAPSATASDQPIPPAIRAGEPGIPWQARQANELMRRQQQQPPAPQQPGLLERLDPARWTGFEGTAQAAEVDPMAGAVRVGDVGGIIPDSHPIKVAESGDPMAGATRVGDAKAPELPLAVKIGDWLPTIGQFGGEAAAGILGAPEAAAMVASAPITGPLGPVAGMATEAGLVGLGGGVGAGAMEVPREAIRRWYGLPVTPQLKQAAEAGFIGSAAGVVGGRAIPHALPGFKVIGGAAEDYKAAEAAAGALKGQVGQAVGMSVDEAAAKRSSEEAAAQAVTGVQGIRKSVRDRLGQSYDSILNPVKNDITPGASRAAFMRLPIPLRKAIIAQLNRKFPPQEMVDEAGVKLGPVGRFAFYQKYPTAARVWEMATAAKSVANSLNPSMQGIEIAQVRDFIKATDGDMASVLGPQGLRSKATLDRLWAKLHVEYPSEMMSKIRDATSMDEVGGVIKNPKTLNLLLRDIDRITNPAGKAEALKAVRDAVSSAMWKTSSEGTSEPQKLGALMRFIAKIPDETWQRLYGTSQRDLLETGQATKLMHDRMLKNPNLRIAVDRALQSYKTSSPHIYNYMKHHAVLPVIGAGIGAAHAMASGGGVAGATEEAGVGAAAGLAVGGVALLTAKTMISMTHSDIALGFYRRAVTGRGTPEAIAANLRNAFAALATQELAHTKDQYAVHP